MDEYALTEHVLPGSGIHVQWHAGLAAWRWIPDAALRRLRERGQELTAWPTTWTGDPASFTRIRIPARVDGRLDHWRVLIGELPSPQSQVEVKAADGTLFPVSVIMDDRLWTCEWTHPPDWVTVRVDGGTEVPVSFARRRMHLPDGNPVEPDPHASPGRVLHGWYRYAGRDRLT